MKYFDIILFCYIDFEHLLTSAVWFAHQAVTRLNCIKLNSTFDPISEKVYHVEIAREIG